MEKLIIVQITIRPYKTKELARIYQRSERTMRRELALIKYKLGEKDGQQWNREQVALIFEHIPTPYDIVEYEGKPEELERLKKNATFKPAA